MLIKYQLTENPMKPITFPKVSMWGHWIAPHFFLWNTNSFRISWPSTLLLMGVNYTSIFSIVRKGALRNTVMFS